MIIMNFMIRVLYMKITEVLKKNLLGEILGFIVYYKSDYCYWFKIISYIFQILKMELSSFNLPLYN